jgi:large subunit ribosomal protein L9
MRQKLLLIEDVEDLGRSGDVVAVKAGFARNFLVPQKKAVVADKHTLLMQTKLQEERAKTAARDRSEAVEQAKIIEKLTLKIEVKVDPEGRMYGSVAPSDIVELLKAEGVGVDKKCVQLKKHIKELGVTKVPLKLKEGVIAVCVLKVIREGAVDVEEVVVTEEIVEETKAKEEE